MKPSRIFLIVLLIIFIVGACLFFLAFEVREGGLVVKDESRPLLVRIARKINTFIYDEATRHNPKGDLVPDQIDNDIKEKIRENLR